MNRKATLYFCLVLGCLCHFKVTEASAQTIVWDVTDTNALSMGLGLGQLSCSGGNCSACGRDATYESVIYHSNDGGYTWSALYPPIPNHRTENETYISGVYQLDSLTIYGTGSYYNNSLGKYDTSFVIETTDGGVSWSSLQLCNYCSLNYDSEYVGVSGHSIIMTTDGGMHWDTAAFGPWRSYEMFQIHPFGNGKFKVFSNYGIVYSTIDNFHSVDSGQTLPDSANGLQLYFPACFFSGNGDTVIAYGANTSQYLVHLRGVMDVSIDGGMKWLPPAIFDTTVWFVNSLMQVNNKLIIANVEIAANDTSGNIISTDGGITWHDDSLIFSQASYANYSESLLKSLSLKDIILLPNGSSLGEFESIGMVGPVFGIGHLVQSGVEIPTPPSNFTIYPNPASNTLRVQSFVGSITISDPLGRSYDIRQTGNALDISPLPPGVYYLTDGLSRAKFVKE